MVGGRKGRAVAVLRRAYARPVRSTADTERRRARRAEAAVCRVARSVAAFSGSASLQRGHGARVAMTVLSLEHRARG